MSLKVPERWDMETDVAVVGYGAAGAVSAITVHDNSASVIVLEKMPDGGGNSRVSGGNIIIPRSKEFVKYLDTLSYGMIETETSELFVTEAMKHPEWFRQMGGELVKYAPLLLSYQVTRGAAGYPQLEGAEHMEKWNVKGDPNIPAAERLWNLLSSNVKRRGIKIMVNTPAKELVQNLDGEIIGVIAEREGQTVSINARKAVILTCGGYQNDPTLKWDNFPAKPVMFLGNPGNTGDGIRMAQKVGAGLWHMANLSCLLGFKAPEYEAAFSLTFLGEGHIYVDKHGKRFVNELGVEGHDWGRVLGYLDMENIEYPRIPFYCIFDEEIRRRGPLRPTSSGYIRDSYKWSLDNSQEIAKGWIARADSIAKLASRISVDEAALTSTVANYNKYCKTGKDADFGRPKECLKAIERPPYYAVPLYPALFGTQGGPRRDKEARVLDAYGKPIPRLYSAGELGATSGLVYQGGHNLTDCIVFGRIAARNAVAEEPWS